MTNLRQRIISVLQIVISILLLSYIIWRNDPQEILRTLQTMDWRWYLPAFALFIINIILRAYRWYMLLHTLDNRPSFPYLIYLYFVGFFANNFIPSGFGGDIVKIASLRQATGRGAVAASSVIMDRVTGLLGSTLIALLALIWNRITPTNHVDMPPSLWIVIDFISISIPLTLITLRFFNPFLWFKENFSIASKIPAYGKLIELSETVKKYPLQVLLRSLLVSLPFTIILIVIQYSIARALGVDLPIAVFSLFVPIISILNLLPISFNGLGVRETLYQFLFVPIGVPSATAVSMALAFTFLRIASGLIGGLMLAFRNVAAMLYKPQTENM